MTRADRTFAALVCALACAFTVACSSTVTPRLVIPQAPSYSGNELTSGIVSLTPAGFVVDGYFRARYNALIAEYGRDESLQSDAGIVRILDGATPSAERWLIDRQHFTAALRMSLHKHSGIAPKKP